MKVTKITQEQLQQLIKETALKYKKVLDLQKRRDEVKRQLNEIAYGAGSAGEVTEDMGGSPAGEVVAEPNMDEINLIPNAIRKMPVAQKLGVSSPEQKAAADQQQAQTNAQTTQANGMKVIESDPRGMWQKYYAGLLKTAPQQAPKMVEYLAAHPDAKGIKWNPARNEFADINDNITGTMLQKLGTGMSSQTLAK